MTQLLVAALLLSFVCISKTEAQTKPVTHSASDSLLLSPEEMKYLKNIKQLTFGGNNAEAYWSFDESMLVFNLITALGEPNAIRFTMSIGEKMI